MIFKLGPLRVGYADFAAGVEKLGEGYQRRMSAAASENGVDVLRYQAPLPADASPRHARFELLTTVIDDLQGWDERSFEKPRRTANRLGRTALEVRRAEPRDVSVIHRLYTETIARQGGRMRYSREYFEMIAGPSAWVACLKGDVIAFVSSGRAGNRGLYLHGGHDERFRSHYPSDILFLAMIREARQAGLRSFDFLASPRGHTSLLGYKQAWGGRPRPVCVSDQPLSWLGHSFSLGYAVMAAWTRRR
ncbi:hypothetical protein CO641_00485 [Lysobacteraceae bacterium NML91-0213]|nr:hypothetical protein CO641_00485 [Xanthomonadaceae bacterium NML91-0213]